MTCHAVRLASPTYGWWARLARRLGQRWCGVTTGHRYIRQQDGARYRLICWYCDKESTGWDLKIES